MGLQKVFYVNDQTVITAENMNDIQDSIIKLEERDMSSSQNPSQGGLTADERSTLIAIVNAIGTFSVPNGQELMDAFNAAWGNSGDSGGDTTEKTLTSISATYSGGSVPVRTAVADLTGIVVTAHYSDGTSATVTDYTLSGTIAEGSNTITVTYQGKTTTFTVTGKAEADPVEPVYVLASPLTTTGDSVVDTGYALADKDKNWTIVCDLTGKAGYGTPAWGCSAHVGMWAKSAWVWYCGYNLDIYSDANSGAFDLKTGNLSNFKLALAHEKGSNTLTCYYIKDGAFTSSEDSRKTYSNIVGATVTVTLGGATDRRGPQYWAANNTINDFKIYERVLTEDEIKEYLGVA